MAARLTLVQPPTAVAINYSPELQVKVAQKISKAMSGKEIFVGIGVQAGVLASQAAAGEIIISEKAIKESGIDSSDLETRSPVLKGVSEPVQVRVMRIA